MDKYVVVYLYTTYGLKKEASHKRIRAVWFYLYIVQKEAYRIAETKLKKLKQRNDLKKNQDDGYLSGKGGDEKETDEVLAMCVSWPGSCLP